MSHEEHEDHEGSTLSNDARLRRPSHRGLEPAARATIHVVRGIDPEPIATDVVDAAVRLHRDVGPGMKLLDLPLGLLINFGAPLLREGGIRRVLNDYRPTRDFKTRRDGGFTRRREDTKISG